MKKNNRKRITMFFIATSLMLSLVACSKKDSMTIVSEENASAEVPSTEETAEENDSDVTYVENNKLEYIMDTKVTSKGILYLGEDTENFDIIDADWEITNISIGDAEDGIQTITIEQSTEGYIWTDGNIFKTNLNLPTGRLCDEYTGVMIPITEDGDATEIEWKSENYFIEVAESASWEDGNWDTDWIEDPDGGERLSSTLKITTIVKITEGYDGLDLVLVPITDANGNIDGKYIMDVWTDDSYLFNVKEMSAIFVSDAEEVEETDADEAATSADEESEEESKEEAKPAETTTPKEEKPVTHVHDYTSVVSVQPTCIVSGVRTYTCSSCGDSYKEDLGYGSHDFSVPVIQEIFHEEVWQSVPRTVTVKEIRCGCGERFTSNDEWRAHRVARIEESGPFISCAGNYMVEEKNETVYDNVKVSDSYTSEEVVAYKCSICGQQN